MEDACFTVTGQVLKVYPRRQGKIVSVRTGLTPAARDRGMVLGLGGRGTNQSTLPVLSTELGSWLRGQGRHSPHHPGAHSLVTKARQ